MNNHTPGPWTINFWTQKDDRISIGAIGTPLIAYVSSRDVSYNEHKDNANLIAAAPDMLSSLKEITLWLRAALDCETWHWDGDQRAAAESSYELGMTAIARATGEQP